MKNTNTPGPWEAIPDSPNTTPEGRKRYSICAKARSRALNRWFSMNPCAVAEPYTHPGAPICRISLAYNGSGPSAGPDELIDQDEIDANARLIAASPKLLAALESIVPGLVHLVAIAPIPHEQKAEWAEGIKTARAAIAKAVTP